MESAPEEVNIANVVGGVVEAASDVELSEVDILEALILEEAEATGDQYEQIKQFGNFCGSSATFTSDAPEGTQAVCATSLCCGIAKNPENPLEKMEVCNAEMAATHTGEFNNVTVVWPFECVSGAAKLASAAAALFTTVYLM